MASCSKGGSKTTMIESIDAPSTTSNVEKESFVTDQSIQIEEPSVDESPEKSIPVVDPSDVPESEQIEQMLESLNQGLGQFLNIDYENKVFRMTPVQGSAFDPMLREVADTPEEHKEQLIQLSNTLEGFSESIVESLGSGYSIELLNPYNKKGSFFRVKDGQISYPIIKI